MDFATAVDDSELESFGFTDDFIIEIWGIVTDAKSGRLTSRPSESEDESQDWSHLMSNSKNKRRMKT